MRCSAFGRAFTESGVDVGMGAAHLLSSAHADVHLVVPDVCATIARRTARTRDAYLRCVALAAEHGWGQYRVHAAFMDAPPQLMGSTAALSRASTGL